MGETTVHPSANKWSLKGDEGEMVMLETKERIARNVLEQSRADGI